MQSCLAQFLHRAEPQIGPWGARLQQACQAGFQGRDRDVDRQSRFAGNDLQDVDVTHDLVGLGDDGDAQTLALRQFFQAGACDAILPFGGLVGVRGRADGDVFGLRVTRRFRFVGILLRDVARQQRGSILFHENLFLEVPAINFHIFVGVPRVAVFAGKLASPVGIDGPFKGHAVGIATVEDGFHRQQKILRLLHRLALRLRRRGLRSEASNAHQWRTGNLDLRRGAIRLRAIQIPLAPARFTLGKGAGLWSWVWLNRAKRKEGNSGATSGAAPNRGDWRRMGKKWGHSSPRSGAQYFAFSSPCQGTLYAGGSERHPLRERRLLCQLRAK